MAKKPKVIYYPRYSGWSGDRAVFRPITPSEEDDPFREVATHNILLSDGRTATAVISEGKFQGQIGYVLYIDERKQEGIHSIPESSGLEQLEHSVRMTTDPVYWEEYNRNREEEAQERF